MGVDVPSEHAKRDTESTLSRARIFRFFMGPPKISPILHKNYVIRQEFVSNWIANELLRNFGHQDAVSDL